MLMQSHEYATQPSSPRGNEQRTKDERHELEKWRVILEPQQTNEVEVTNGIKVEFSHTVINDAQR